VVDAAMGLHADKASNKQVSVRRDHCVLDLYLPI
jgi:hypothetical protein